LTQAREQGNRLLRERQGGETLAAGAARIVRAGDPAEKVAVARAVGAAWRAGRLGRIVQSAPPAMPERPGRPARPELLPPRDMPRRSMKGDRGRIALLHSLAHIELNAIDLAWDLIGRFADRPMPRSFFDDWVRVGVEEAGHFSIIARRLGDLGAAYGDLPAHDGLWEAAQATGHSLLARLAIIPLVLEARGLDITPSLIAQARNADDPETAKVLEIIYRDELGHVSIGMRWFRFLCDRQRLAPEPTFHDLVRKHFRGRLKPPFNDPARSRAGLVSGFYKPMSL